MAAGVDRTPLISLIMTVRDGARYVAQAIDSVLAQTLDDWELVVWDDGSRDDTTTIVRSYADAEPRIRMFSGEAGGRRRALVEAHRRARGAYLGWIDADDWLAPEALARTHAVIARTGCEMVYTDHLVVGSRGEQRGLGRRSRIPYSARRLLIDFMTFHFRLFSRDVFDRVGGIDPDLEIAIDYDLCLRISEQARIKHLAEPLYYYREHDQQLSTRQRSAQIAASAAAIRAALARRGMSSHELDVDLQRGRFRLVPAASAVSTPPTRWLALVLRTVVPRLRAQTPARRIGERSVIGYWPAPRDSVYTEQLYAATAAYGVHSRPLGRELATLMRAVWTGQAGDALHVHGIGPLLEPAERGSVLASCHLFIRTVDHALARGMRVVWTSRGPLTVHPRHAAEERWCRRALAVRCHTIVTHWRADEVQLRELGAPPERTMFVPHPSLVDGYPEVSRDHARAQLGLPIGDAPTVLYLGGSPTGTLLPGALVLAGDLDLCARREAALHFAAADVVVLPAHGFTSGALALAMAMGKPIVAPSLRGVAEIAGDDAVLYSPAGGERSVEDAVERAVPARQDWDRIGRANVERVRDWTWDAPVAAVIDSNLVDGLHAAWSSRPVSAVINASLFDIPYLAVALPHILRQARFAFAERIVIIDPRVPARTRYRPHGQPAELERIVNDAKRAGIIDRVIELDTSDAAQRTIRARYFERGVDANGDTARSIFPALFGLESARHDLVAWFRPDLLFHASGDGWVTAGLHALARDRELWLASTGSGPRALISRRLRTASSRHFLCDRRRLHGTLREVDAPRERLGRSVTNALERHRAFSATVPGAWHVQPRSPGPPFPDWIERLRDSVEHGVVPPDQHDGCLRLDDPVRRSSWRKLLFPSAGVTPRPSRIAKLIERRAVPGSAPLSIVIPIRNRAGADVRNALASLAWQTSGRPWEVIVVSHGSEPRVDAELRSLVIEAGATLITVGRPEDPWCKALALNTGIRATDPTISFVMTMDGDMLLAENMLDTVITELRDDPEKIVLCQSSDLPQDCELPEPAAIRAQFALLAQRATVRGTYGTGGIQAMRRRFLFDVRGYDEDMLWWGAVDTDLVRRAEATGMRTSWITHRTTMLHQWHPTKHRVLDEAERKDEARSAWLRNHELMVERAREVERNKEAWGATLEAEGP